MFFLFFLLGIMIQSTLRARQRFQLDHCGTLIGSHIPPSSTALADAAAVRSPPQLAAPPAAAPPPPVSGWGRRASTRRQSVLARAQSVRRPGRAGAGSGRARASSQQGGQRQVPDERKAAGEPTHFRWNASVRLKKSRRTSESYNFRRKSAESVKLIA